MTTPIGRFQAKVFPIALDANGAASGQGARIENNNSAVQWEIGQVGVITNPQQSGCTATLGPPGGFLDTAYFAGTGDTFLGRYFLQPHDYLQFVVTSGPPNGVLLATVVFIESPV